MTTVLAAICPWIPGEPPAGLTFVSDTRSTSIDGSTGQIVGRPYDAALKMFPIGSSAIVGFAGVQSRAEIVVREIRAVFTDNRIVRQGPEAAIELLQAIERANATVDASIPRDLALLVGFRSTGETYNLLSWDFEEGLKSIADGRGARGPLAIGTGSSPRARAIFDEELAATYEKNLREENKILPGGHHGDKLLQHAHVLGAAFTNAYLDIGLDSYTGGGAIILTLRSNGVEEYEVVPYRLKPGEEPGEGKWRWRTPPFLTTRPMKPGEQAMVPGRLRGRSQENPIAGLLSDHHEVLSALVRMETNAEGLIRIVTAEEARRRGLLDEARRRGLLPRKSKQGKVRRSKRKGNPKQGRRR